MGARGAKHFWKGDLKSLLILNNQIRSLRSEGQFLLKKICSEAMSEERMVSYTPQATEPA